MNSWVIVDRVLSCDLIREYGSISFALICVSDQSTNRSIDKYLHEIREHAFPTPSRISESFPRIIVIGPASVPAHSIQYAATTEHFALGHRARITIQLCLGHRDKIPIVDATNVSTNVDRILNQCFIVVTVGF